MRFKICTDTQKLRITFKVFTNAFNKVKLILSLKFSENLSRCLKKN